MHDIEIKKKKKRYEGSKGKLIHLEDNLFEFLDAVAKHKNMTLKRYIEDLCKRQAIYEANRAKELNE